MHVLQVTLMDWGNCIMHDVTKGADGKVTGIKASLHLQGDFKKTKLKLTWLSDVPDLVPLRLVTLGDLITKAKVRLCGGIMSESCCVRGSMH
jgi:glutamyl-tRNA synthetase